jgi:protein TonB
MVYPAAARMSGFHGKARVEFVFRDGRFSQVRLIQGSGSGMIDRAALAAVMAAICPPIPESLKGRSMTYQVALLFDLVSAD